MSTHPCCNIAHKTKMRWTTTMKISSRGLHCPSRLSVRLVCSAAAGRESRPNLLVKTIFRVIKFI
jgi:hypothetical protein